MEDRDITFLQSTFQQLSQLTTTVLQGEIKLKQEQVVLKQQQIQFQKEKEEFEKQKEQWNQLKAEELRKINAKNEAFNILKELPPTMHIKGKNEHFPIVRFCYKQYHSWYQPFIEQFNDLCRVLRNIHGSNRCPESLQIQIVAVFHFKNFPTYSFNVLRVHVHRLIMMLEDIHRQFPDVQLMNNINWFKNLEYPLDEARQPITVHLDTDPNFMRNLEAIRTAWGPEEYISDEEETEEEQAEEPKSSL